MLMFATYDLRRFSKSRLKVMGYNFAVCYYCWLRLRYPYRVVDIYCEWSCDGLFTKYGRTVGLFPNTSVPPVTDSISRFWIGYIEWSTREVAYITALRKVAIAIEVAWLWMMMMMMMMPVYVSLACTVISLSLYIYIYIYPHGLIDGRSTISSID